MAPEQCRGGSKLTKQADIYALGIVLYEMLVGHTPFGNNCLPSRPLLHPSYIKTSLPKEVDEVVLKALEIEPEKRFSSAEEMSDAFKVAIAQPIGFKNGETTQRTIPILSAGSPNSRNPSQRITLQQYALVGLITMVLVVILVAMYLHSPGLVCARYTNAGQGHILNLAITEGINDFETALESKPDCIPALLKRGYAFFLMQEYDLAEADLTQAIALQDTHEHLGEANYYLAQVYQTTSQNELAYTAWLNTIEYSDRESDLQSTWISEAEEAVSQYRAHACSEYNAAGLGHRDEREYAEAIDDFQTATTINPACEEAYFNLGVTYEEYGDPEEARIAYETALELDDQLLSVRYRLGELLLDLEEIDAGFRTIDLGIVMLRNGSINLDEAGRQLLSFQLYAARGRAYYLLGEFNLAEDDLDLATTFADPEDHPAQAYYYLALIYTATGRDEIAYTAWLDTLSNIDEDIDRHRRWANEAREAIAQYE